MIKHAINIESLAGEIRGSQINRKFAQERHDELIRRHQRMIDCEEFGGHQMEDKAGHSTSSNYAVCSRCRFEIGASYIESCGD